MIQGKNIVAFSKEWISDWTSNHHILTTLARKNRILWINSIGMRSPNLTSHKDWRKIAKKVFTSLKGIEKVHKNFYIFTPLLWPFQRPLLLRKLSLIFLTFQVRVISNYLRMRNCQLWTFLPTAEPLIGKLNEKLSVYYCTDYWKFYPYLNGSEIFAQEEKLLKKVNIVFTSSRFLCKQKKKYNPNTFLCTHGVNPNFLKERAKLKKPEDLRKIPKPVLGFYGWLRETIDQNLLYQLSQEYPDYSIVLIGKVTGDFSLLEKMQNIYFLGQKPYPELPFYAANFDVALMPYILEPKELRDATNSVKFKEYLALGLPVVTTDMAEVRPYARVCWIAHSNKEFIRYVSGALGPKGKRRSKLSRKIVAKETWEAKVNEISRTTERFL